MFVYRVVDDNFAFVIIQGYGKLSQQDQIVGIVVHDCQVIDHYSEKLGEPLDLLKVEERPKGILPPVIVKEKLRSCMREEREEESEEPEIRVEPPRSIHSLPIQRIENRSSIRTI